MNPDAPTPAPTRPLWKSPYFWGAVAGLILIPAIRPFLRHIPEPPPKIGQVTEFSLTDQSGAQFGTKQLEGQVWVAAFFFSSCTTVCPPMMKALRQLEDRYERADLPMQIVTISVDPVTDTPEVLAQYGKNIGADFERWHFLTGDESEIRVLAEKGFLAYMGERSTNSDGLMDIGHSGRLMLVDREGGLRGSYESTKLGVDEIFHRSKHVARQR